MRFMVLLGGMETLEELCEILIWVQLELHQKNRRAAQHRQIF